MDEQLLADMAIEHDRRRRRAWALSPEKRLELADKLTQSSMLQLEQNPVAFKAYVKRQHNKRRDSNCRRLERECATRRAGV